MENKQEVYTDLEKVTDMKKLAGWVFTYNEFTNKWQAAKREDYSLLFNDISNKKVVKSSSIKTLLELIMRTDGDETKLNRLVRGK